MSEATGHQQFIPYSFSGVDRKFLDVAYKEQIVITEHSRDYEVEMDI